MSNSRSAEGSTGSPPEPSGLGAWVKRHWLLSTAMGALVTTTIGFLVNRFGPGIVEGITSEAPLRFVVSRVPPLDGEAFALPGLVGEGDLPGPPSARRGVPGVIGCFDILDWLARQGAVDAGDTRLKVSIEGLNSSPVLIQSMRARIEARRDPISNTLLTCPVEGEIGVIKIGFNLDEQPAVARILKDDNTLGRPYFEGSGITVADGEVLAMSVAAFTEQCFCDWRIEIDAVVEGDRQTFVLDDHGRPFQTTAIVTVPSRRIVLYAGEVGYCDGEFSCFPDGLPGQTKPTPIPEGELQELREQGTSQVLYPS